jgi:AraC-like DNA-binding protein
MAKQEIPVYDICSISQKNGSTDLLIQRFGDYLKTHYQQLHRPHRHSFYHFVLFTKGSGYHTIDFDRYPVKPWQLYCMIPGQVHSWHFDGETDGYLVHFNETLFTTFLHNGHYLDRFGFFLGPGSPQVMQLPPEVQQSATAIMETLLAEMTGNATMNPDLIRIKLLEFFILAERINQSTNRKPIPRQKHTLLRSFQQLIERHYLTTRLPKEYAELLYITPNHLNALCQDLLGKSAGELIRDRVLLEAKRLLTNAEMTSSQIAAELHFEDSSYFTRFFRKYTGLTPEAFRKSIYQEK